MQSPLTLLENHLEFLATHRGKVTRLADAFSVESERPEFTYAILKRAGDHELLKRFDRMQLLPGETWNDPRFKKGFSLSYMTFEGAPWKRNPEIEVKKATNPADIAVFTHVQAAGFNQKPEDYDRWHPWLLAANQRNLGRRGQAFYIGYVDGKPVGTTLIVHTEGLAGIYAVATLPEFRKRGVSTTVMSHALSEALSPQITLQVMDGSYAQSLYEKLGFKTAFHTDFFLRNP